MVTLSAVRRKRLIVAQGKRLLRYPAIRLRTSQEVFAHFLRDADRAVRRYERTAAGIIAKLVRSRLGIRRYAFDAVHADSQHFGYHLHLRGDGGVAHFMCAGEQPRRSRRRSFSACGP